LQLYYLFNFTNTSAVLDVKSLYCNVLILPLNEGPSEVSNCNSLQGRTRSMKFVPSLTYFHSDQSNEQIPIFLTRLPEGEETIVTISEKARSAFLMGYSIITLYVSVIFVAGRLIRGFIYGIFNNLYTKNRYFV